MGSFDSLVGKKSPEQDNNLSELAKAAITDSDKETFRAQVDEGKGKRSRKTVQQSEDEKLKKSYVPKYSSDDLLAESVLIAGRPKFLIAEKNGSISIKDAIVLDDRILKPLEPESYLSKPYCFTSDEQVRVYTQKAKNENLDSQYAKVKWTCQKFIDADHFHTSLLAADIIYTYYQDRIGLTHYLFFVGKPGSGKSNNLTLIHWLGYRNFMSTDITPANIYQFLGNYEEGQGTLCVDEADSIDLNPELMCINKNGYTKGFPVARIDLNNARKQYKYFTFSFKAFAAERTPDIEKAKGFNERTVEIHCLDGNPQYDISEVVNPAGEQKHQDLVNELEEMRNTMLIYRLLHYHESIPDVKLNIENREKQLFKPLSRIFQNDRHAWDEIRLVISEYLSKRRQNNTSTLNAFLYRHIKGLIKSQDTTELSS